MTTPDIEKLRELASEMLAALTALYEACERRANEEGGDFGDDIGPAAELADAAIAKAALLDSLPSPVPLISRGGVSDMTTPAEDARREAEIRDDFAAAPASWRVPTLLRLLDTERARITEPEGERDTATRALADLREAAGSVLFHQLCCLGDCHESMASMARLAKLIGFETDPATAEEIEEALVAPHDSGKTHECYVEERDTATRALADLAKIAWLAAEEDSWFGNENDIAVQRAAAERHRAALSKTEKKGDN